MKRSVRGSIFQLARLVSSRACPLSYRYTRNALAEAPTAKAKVLYCIGGLYGNVEALDTILRIIEPEATVVFNGDFNFFNKDMQSWERINREVMKHEAVSGNVELEAIDFSSHSCGCAYPSYVSDDVATRSDQIVGDLRQTARLGSPEIVSFLKGLPKFRAFSVNDQRILVIHGDVDSLAGWGLSVEAVEPLDAELRELLQCDESTFTSKADLLECFSDTKCDVLASTHTCLPFAQTLRAQNGALKFVVNNGSAGMPNFRDSRFGLITRIAADDCPPPIPPVYSSRQQTVRIDAIPVAYNHHEWIRQFLSHWPKGSPAHESYFSRIADGVEFFGVSQAARDGFSRT